jgi:DNA replication protein DnaC
MDVPAGDPNFGVLITCSCKVAEKERRAHEKLLRLCNMDAFADKTFETFDRTIQGVERAYQRAVNFAREPRGWLIFFGNYGCGKTHLAAAIANQLIQRDCRLFFSNVPDLLDHLRSTFGPSSEVEYDERFETIRNSPVLILDDLGTENTTPWAREKLYQLINHRYNNHLATVITSNYKPHDIDERIFSRMSDVALCGEITMIDAADYRKYPLEQRRLMGRRKAGFSVAGAGSEEKRL